MTVVDRRVLILGQLVTILSEFSIALTTGAIAVGNIVHNRNQLPADKVPGLILLDADEVKDPRALPVNPGRQLPPSTCLMRMTPEIYIVLDVREPTNIDVGEDLNTARAAIIDLVLHDPTLQTIVGSNGQIVYDGCFTDLARNRTMKGQMGLSFTFVFPFIPNELIGANGE